MAEEYFKSVDQRGSTTNHTIEWNDIVKKQIADLTQQYSNDSDVKKALGRWHEDITLGIKHNKNYSPHINGFYMIWMQHGTWYENFLLSQASTGAGFSPGTGKVEGISASIEDGPLKFSTFANSFNMLATDIDIPDITQEYTAVSSRIRNSFVPSRNYFVSDFNISYIENINLEVIRYHEAWLKYMERLKRGEIKAYNDKTECAAANSRDIFLDMPFTNAVWVAVFRPFTTDIQLLIKLMGVMPVNMPLKQVVGNRSNSKMTVLNIQYKAADMFYKFYNGSKGMLEDKGDLFKAFKAEILKPLADATTTPTK